MLIVNVGADFFWGLTTGSLWIPVLPQTIFQRHALKDFKLIFTFQHVSYILANTFIYTLFDYNKNTEDNQIIVEVECNFDPPRVTNF